MTWHALAGAAGLGAWFRWSPGWWIVLAAGVLAGWRRSLVGGLVVVFLVAGWLGDRATQGLEPPPAGPVEGWVTLTSDPRASGPVGVRVSGRWGAHRISLTAHGAVAGRLDDGLAGEQVRIVGNFRPASASSWTRWRHEVGTITVTQVVARAPGAPLSQTANGVRGILQAGAASLGRDDRAVFLGMVVGDDRQQSAVVADDFRAAGLGHLLVVSGQNVAFVLMLLEPVMRRVRPAGRLVGVSVVLVAFLTITRFEASVLRASVMAGAGVGAAVLGGPIDGRKALSGSVLALVLIDPFLVRVLAFQLSVAATAGIVWLGLPLAERLRGPTIIRAAIATTASAQLAVSPLLIATFGPVPLAALPANLLAGPASGPIMMWGCTAGMVAGILGEPVAGWIHIPTGVLVGWVRLVAATTTTFPFVGVGVAGLWMLGAAVGGALSRSRATRAVAAMLVVLAMVLAVHQRPQPDAGTNWLGVGVTVHVSTSTIVVLDDPWQARDVLEALRLSGITEVHVVVATDGDRADADAVVALRARYGDLQVFAPPMHRVPTASSVRPGQRVVMGGRVVVPVTEDDEVRLAFVEE